MINPLILPRQVKHKNDKRREIIKYQKSICCKEAVGDAIIKVQISKHLILSPC